MSKDWYPQPKIFKRKDYVGRGHLTLYQATLFLGLDETGKETNMHFYGRTVEEVQQDLEDAYELLGEERMRQRLRRSK